MSPGDKAELTAHPPTQAQYEPVAPAPLLQRVCSIAQSGGAFPWQTDRRSVCHAGSRVRWALFPKLLVAAAQQGVQEAAAARSAMSPRA